MLISIVAADDAENRQEQNFDIEENGPILDVVEIVQDSLIHLLIGFRTATATVDLGQSGHTWHHLVPVGIFLNPLFELRIEL